MEKGRESRFPSFLLSRKKPLWQNNLDFPEERLIIALACGKIQNVRGCVCLAEVRLQEGESLENALRRFKRKVQQEDIIKEVKRHSYYLKPGEKRRVKAALARKRARKKTRRDYE